MLDHKRLDDGIEVWSSEKGEYRYWFATPNVLRTRFTGHLTIEFVPKMLHMQNEAIRATSGVHLFVDWEGMTAYDSEARIRLTEWTQKMLPNTSSWNILVSAKLVAMGVNVANASLRGGLGIFTDRAAFETAFENAIRGGA